MIQQNQDQFMNLLSEGIPAEEEEGAAENVITITPEENSAIERVLNVINL